MRKGLYNIVKRVLFGKTERPFRLLSGLGKNMVFLIDPASNSQRILGLAEAEIKDYFRQSVLKTRTFVDIGASDGYYPLIASVLNDSAEIFGCEPKTDMGKRFEKNLSLNKIKKPERIKWVSSFIGKNRTELDELLKDSYEPIFLKIDVDGSEIEVLESAKNILEHKNICLIIETHSKELEKRCIEILEHQGFRIKIIKKAWWRLFIPEDRPIAHNRWLYAEKKVTSDE